MSMQNKFEAGPHNRWRGIRGAWRELAQAFAALVAGSRVVPLGDNGELIRALAARLRSTTDR